MTNTPLTEEYLKGRNFEQDSEFPSMWIDTSRILPFYVVWETGRKFIHLNVNLEYIIGTVPATEERIELLIKAFSIPPVAD